MADSRIVFQLDTVLLGDTVMFAHCGKKFSLFDRINTKVGFHIQVQIKHIFRITRLFGYHFDYFFRYRRFIKRGRRFSGRSHCGLCHRSRLYRSRSRNRCGRGCLYGSGFARISEHKFNAMADSRIIFQLDAVLLGNAIMFAQGSKEFSLFDRINAEVGFHIQVNIKHIFRIASLFSHHTYYFFRYAGFIQRGHRFSGRSHYGLCHRSRLYRSRSRNRCWRGCLYGHRFARISEHKFNAMADSRVVFQLDAVLLGNAIMLTQGSKKFCLFDRINAEVGFHI